MDLILDTETSGLPRNWHAPASDVHNWPRLVQLAWLLFDDAGALADSASHIVTPDGFDIPPEAARIHGITTERALAEGVPLAGTLQELSAVAERAGTVVAHNMAFDQKILEAEYLRAGMAIPFAGKRLLCTMTSSTDFCRLPGRYGYKWPTLPELHRALFRAEVEEAHEAAADAAACAKCFFELRRLGVM